MNGSQQQQPSLREPNADAAADETIFAEQDITTNSTLMPDQLPLRKACETCHNRRMKCTFTAGAEKCVQCDRRGIQCVRQPEKKRGRKFVTKELLAAREAQKQAKKRHEIELLRWYAAAMPQTIYHSAPPQPLPPPLITAYPVTAFPSCGVYSWPCCQPIQHSTGQVAPVFAAGLQPAAHSAALAHAVSANRPEIHSMPVRPMPQPPLIAPVHQLHGMACHVPSVYYNSHPSVHPAVWGAPPAGLATEFIAGAMPYDHNARLS